MKKIAFYASLVAGAIAVSYFVRNIRNSSAIGDSEVSKLQEHFKSLDDI